MHFEFLVEDASGKIALNSLVEKLLGPNDCSHSYRIISYKGVGRIPKGMGNAIDAKKRILLDRLPRLLRGYGNSLRDFPAVVVVVVDLDRQDCKEFKRELLELANGFFPKPSVIFRIAIEEMEAWYLGDQHAIITAYPNARKDVLDQYVQDSIVGTWELLAEAIHPGGARDLKDRGWPAPGQAKCEWARTIAPLMDVEGNMSPSFCVFRDGVRSLAE